MVRIVLPAASLTGVMQDRVASPSIRHGAGPAESRPAAELRADETKFVTQRPQEGHLRLDINRDFPSIDNKKGHGSLRSRLPQRETGPIEAHECGGLGHAHDQIGESGNILGYNSPERKPD